MLRQSMVALNIYYLVHVGAEHLGVRLLLHSPQGSCSRIGADAAEYHRVHVTVHLYNDARTDCSYANCSAAVIRQQWHAKTTSIASCLNAAPRRDCSIHCSAPSVAAPPLRCSSAWWRPA